MEKKVLHPLVLKKSQKRYQKWKRLVDMLFAVVVLITAFPLLVVIGIAIKIEEPTGKVFFTQTRVGKDGHAFEMIKFRSMKSFTPANKATGELENPELYISKIGYIIRKNSMDEIPQFWNVLKGDMSIIGPRPLIVEEQEIHEMRIKYGVYQVMPGITGLAQVNGRDLLTTEEKVFYDWQYVKNLGVKQDLCILGNTLKTVLMQDGYREGKLERERSGIS